jgi:hypothetical protein
MGENVKNLLAREHLTIDMNSLILVIEMKQISRTSNTARIIVLARYYN